MRKGIDFAGQYLQVYSQAAKKKEKQAAANAAKKARRAERAATETNGA